jgi:signal transduction histidine kinase
MDSIGKSLQELIAGTAPEIGVSFFNVFIEHLAKAYGAQYALVNELIDDDPLTVRTLAFWQDGQLAENFEYQVKTTPCEKVYEQGSAYYPSGIQQNFQKDTELVDMGVNSYLGTQLVSHDGKVIGHICVLGANPVGEHDNAQEILKVFAARASAELERIKMEEEILQQRDRLKDLVDEKTQELKLAKEIAEHASKAKTEFTSRMSHELRTPLNVIIGYTEMLKENLDGQLPGKDKEYLDTIMSSGWELLKLVEDVLDLSKMETGEISEVSQDCHLNTILESSIARLQPKASNKHIGIVINNKSTDLLSLLTNKEHLEKIIHNLLSNAIKFNVDKGTIDITTSLEDNKVKIAIKDSGPGISKLDQSKVFDKFERLEADKACIQGAGIGLAMTKRLVEHLDGEIGIESIEGDGSTFWVELPTE